MKIWSKIAMAILGLSLAACASVQQQQAVERDLAEMKRRLADAERTVATLQQKIESSVQAQQTQAADRLQALAQSQADHRAEIDSLRVEMQSFAGRFEDLGRERREARDEIALMRDDLALKITAIEDRLAKMAAAPVVPAAAPEVKEPPEALYQRGVEAIQMNDFAGGRRMLQEFLRLDPKTPLGVNALYWIGESFQGERKYEDAILQYQEAIEKYRDHPKVAAALLKQGYAFAALGDRKNARVVLQRLVETFPLSDEAKKGKERLLEWGNEKGKN